MPFTKQARNATSFTKVARSRGGKAARYGIARFGQARYGQADEWTRSDRNATSFTKTPRT